jgi:hypothetical protein
MLSCGMGTIHSPCGHSHMSVCGGPIHPRTLAVFEQCRPALRPRLQTMHTCVAVVLFVQNQLLTLHARVQDSCAVAARYVSDLLLVLFTVVYAYSAALPRFRHCACIWSALRASQPTTGPPARRRLLLPTARRRCRREFPRQPLIKGITKKEKTLRY